jgi:putative phosphonate metabolism protein
MSERDPVPPPQEFTRYAVYFTPPPGAWAALGASWLGWDVAQGQPVPHPDIAALPAPPEALTETPRKYGFHATLKAPMRLAAQRTPQGLADALETVAAQTAPVTLEGLAVSTLGHFVALTPRGDVTALNAFAAGLVTSLDGFRAPATEAELARRRKSGLSPRQDALMLKWGYPYVLEEFRFHMTLSGRLDPEAAKAVQSALAPHFAQLLPGQVVIDAVTLAGEGADGRFREIRRYPLLG